MPIYEYSCTACGARVERMQRISEKPLTDCPVCKGVGTLKKLISHSAFHLKGSGWYVTDYAGKKTGVADGADNNGHGANGNGGAPSTEKEAAKPATEAKAEKTETKSTDN